MRILAAERLTKGTNKEECVLEDETCELWIFVLGFFNFFFAIFIGFCLWSFENFLQNFSFCFSFSQSSRYSAYKTTSNSHQSKASKPHKILHKTTQAAKINYNPKLILLQPVIQTIKTQKFPIFNYSKPTLNNFQLKSSIPYDKEVRKLTQE